MKNALVIRPPRMIRMKGIAPARKAAAKETVISAIVRMIFRGFNLSSWNATRPDADALVRSMLFPEISKLERYQARQNQNNFCNHRTLDTYKSNLDGLPAYTH